MFKRTKASTAMLAALAMSLAIPSWSWAADNTASGDINGVGADLTDSNTFTINSSTLALVKAAFLTASGAALASGATVPKGTQVDFLIYVDNTTAIPVADLNVSDPLTGFTYETGTIKVDNSQNTGATAAAIYASAILQTALDDGVNGTDEAGISGTTVSAGSGAGNTQLDILASKVWAMVFTVTVN